MRACTGFLQAVQHDIDSTLPVLGQFWHNCGKSVRHNGNNKKRYRANADIVASTITAQGLAQGQCWHGTDKPIWYHGKKQYWANNGMVAANHIVRLMNMQVST